MTLLFSTEILSLIYDFSLSQEKVLLNKTFNWSFLDKNPLEGVLLLKKRRHGRRGVPLTTYTRSDHFFKTIIKKNICKPIDERLYVMFDMLVDLTFDFKELNIPFKYSFILKKFCQILEIDNDIILRSRMNNWKTICKMNHWNP